MGMETGGGGRRRRGGAGGSEALQPRLGVPGPASAQVLREMAAAVEAQAVSALLLAAVVDGRLVMEAAAVDPEAVRLLMEELKARL